MSMAENAIHTSNEDTSARHHHGLGLAGAMTRTFIHSPLSPLLLLAALAMGILGLLITPRQEDPQISVPMVDVFIRYPGASADQVASLAIDPLERLLSEISGVKHVYSVSQRGQGMATVEFDVGESMEASLVKLYDKLESNKDKIPPGVVGPMVKPKGVDDVPVVTLTLWSHDITDAQLRLLALDVMQRLKEVPNTSQSSIIGGRSEELRIEVFPERLKGFGIGFDQIAETIKNANSERGTGHVEAGDSSYTIYTGSFLRNAVDVERLVVGVRNGTPVYVRDITQVRETPADAHDLVMYYTGPASAENIHAPHGAPAVTIAIAKKTGSNGVTVANALLEKVDYLRGRLVPDNVQVSVTRNYGATANDKVNELVFKLFVATGLVTLLIWALLGFRAAVVVLIVIPVVILITVFSAYVLGYTIDRVSLFALIFSIGILVDDAIVVVENIYRRWLEKGEIDTETSVDAVREVGNPTILATFTVIAALLPMGFVSGMMGPYMEPIPALGSVAMLFSLFAAFIFTPWLAMRIRPSLARLKSAQAREHRQVQGLDRLFRRLIIPLLESRVKGYAFLLINIGLFLSCLFLFYTKDVTVKMLPFDNKSEFNVVVNMPAGTALPVTANVTQRLVEEVLKIPEVMAVQTHAGTASPFNFNGLVRHYYLRQDPWYGDVQIQLLDKRARERSSHQIASAAREILTPLAQALGARIAVVEMPPGPPVLQTLVAEIYGPDAAVRRQTARELTAIFARTPGVVDVDNLMQEAYEIWRFEVNREKAVRHGVSVEDINRQLDMAMGGARLGDIKVGRVLEPRHIVLQVPMALRSQFARLGEIPVLSQTGQMIPLAELGRFVSARQDALVFHKDLRALEFVTGDMTGRLGAPIYGMLGVEDEMASYRAPDDVTVATHYLGPPADDSKTAFEWTGEWTVTYETFRDMGIAFAAAMVLIYMLVVWEFGNFILPAIIMAPIPLTLVGIIPGHWLFDAEFTATSMIGFIALAGIIVRNSILLVDFSKQAVDRGETVREAVIQACRTRTRPILITVFALMGGSFVILTDPIFQGMAISLMFGSLVSTLLTLLIIPLGCVSAAASFLPIPHASGGGVPSGGGLGQPVAAMAATTKATTEAEAETAQPSVFMRAWSVLGFVFAVLRLPVVLLVMLVRRWLASRPVAPLPPVPPPSKPPVPEEAGRVGVTEPTRPTHDVPSEAPKTASEIPATADVPASETPAPKTPNVPVDASQRSLPPMRDGGEGGGTSEDAGTARENPDVPAPPLPVGSEGSLPKAPEVSGERAVTSPKTAPEVVPPALKMTPRVPKVALRGMSGPKIAPKVISKVVKVTKVAKVTAKALGKPTSAGARPARGMPSGTGTLGDRGQTAASGEQGNDTPPGRGVRRLRRGIRLKLGPSVETT
ncbi:MAG: acriflavin resistance protein [Rhodospirillaceae bacterium]|nr:MAG: acriflavin resistance protein [Rhodospirillaceae bacterium]